MSNFKLNPVPAALYTESDCDTIIGLITPLLLRVDSYKGEHWWAMNDEVEYSHLYLEARKGDSEIMMANVQYFIRQLTTRITKEMVEFVNVFAVAHSGGVAEFNFDGWMTIVNEFDGKLPLEIRALPEGTVTKPGTPMLVMRNTKPGFAWLTHYFGDMILQIWKSCAVAGRSFRMKRKLKDMAVKTAESDIIEEWLPYALNDFGTRANGTNEESAVMGIGHAMNCRGSDNWSATYLLMQLYGLTMEQMATNSVFAIEHNVILSYDKSEESPRLLEMALKCLRDGRIGSLLVDTYDIDKVLEFFNDHKYTIMEAWYEGDCKGKLVFRPDSGDRTWTPIGTVLKVMESYEHTVNSKGFKSLPPYLGVIQGDAVSEEMLIEFEGAILEAKLAITNFVFGCGGELIANHTRDDLSWAAKASVMTHANDDHRKCSKSPKYGKGKTTKEGFFHVFADANGDLKYEQADDFEVIGLLVPYFKDGDIVRKEDWYDIVARAHSYV